MPIKNDRKNKIYFKEENFMKKLFLMLAVVMLFCVNAAYSAEYYLDGFVFAANGTSGTALTENSFATMHAYRTGINNQIGTLDSPGRVYPLAVDGNAAFYGIDIGSSFWAVTTAAEGQTITAVFEVYDPLFGWAGPSYIACTKAIVTADEVINLQTEMSPVQLIAIPTPQIDSLDVNQAVLSMTGINENFINSYNLYRSTTLTGTYTLVTTVPQNMGNTIQYADNGVLSGTDYYYKWGVNFDWGGGNGAPSYYTSTAKSPARGPVTAPTATQTSTEISIIILGVDTFTATCTGTETIADTFTVTATLTPVATAAGSLTIDLQSACGFAVLAGSGFDNTGTSTINGDLGSFPTISETGLDTLTINGTDQAGGTITQNAKNDLVTAYNGAAGCTTTATIATELGGTTQLAGVYDSVAGTFGITGTLLLDANGDSNAIFVFKTASTLTTAANSFVSLTNGAQAKNVFWVVGSSATLEAGTTFKGTILAMTSITLAAGATVDGRLLARNGQVSMLANMVSINSCGAVSNTATMTATVTDTVTNTVTKTVTNTVTNTCTPTDTVTDTYTPTVSETITQTITPTITATVSNTATRTATSTVVNTATATPIPTPPVNYEPITFPQPAANTITFAYKLIVPASVKIYVYNMMGTEVAIFDQAAGVPGINTSVCNVSKFPPGIYFYIIKVPDTGKKFKVNKFMIER